MNKRRRSRALCRLLPPPHAPSPVGLLYPTALGVVFDFLEFRELHRVLSVSRSWCAAVCSVPCLRHEWSCTAQSSAPHDWRDTSARFRPLCRATRFRFWRSACHNSAICYARSFPRMSERWCCRRSCVSIPRLNSASLLKLLRMPHALRWTELRELCAVGSQSAAALRNLPGLLHLDTWDCCNVSFVPALSQLRQLELQIRDDPWAVTADAVVDAVSSCSQLTCLCLLAPLTSKHLTALLTQLTMLRALVLNYCAELESLAFLSAVPSLQRTLLVLKLHHCNHHALRSAELRHIFALRNLTALKLQRSLADPLDGLTQHLLTPPSTVLPKLESFEYEPAAAAAAGAAAAVP